MNGIIQNKLRKQSERVGVAASLALNVVNAGDRISDVLNIGFRPKLFQDMREQWIETSDLERTLRDAADYIDALEAMIKTLAKD